MEYFPFDEQTCFLRLGTWAYDGLTVSKLIIVIIIILVASTLKEREEESNFIMPFLFQKQSQIIVAPFKRKKEK